METSLAGHGQVGSEYTQPQATQFVKAVKGPKLAPAPATNQDSLSLSPPRGLVRLVTCLHLVQETRGVLFTGCVIERPRPRRARCSTRSEGAT